MSNPTNALHRRQQFHRRQNSTPLAFEAIKAPMIQTPAQRQQNSHRRGQSLDTINRLPQEDQTVSTTNAGLTPNGQHTLREAQQIKIARPGQHHPQVPSPLCETFFQNQQYFPFSNSNPGTPSAYFDDPSTLAAPGVQVGTPGAYPSELGMPVPAEFESIDVEMDGFSGQDYFQPDHLPVSDTVDQQLMQLRRQSQPDAQAFHQQPSTPTHQIAPCKFSLHGKDSTPNQVIAYFPLTPNTNSFPKFSNDPQRQYPATAHSSPTRQRPARLITSIENTPMQRGRSSQGQFSGGGGGELPSPPGTIQTFSRIKFDMASRPEPRSSTAESFPMMKSLSHQSLASSHPSPTSTMSPSASHFYSSPEKAPMLSNESDKVQLPRLEKAPVPVLPSSQTMPDLSRRSSPVRASLSPRRMSISDLNLEPGISASIEETNVTLDDIANFIEGPDPVDNKWVCRFDECNKRFGRKENIKSHVQTHLGDRQFRCDHCNKCFVRGHDLKRHAKIHTGAKPYPCDCGNSFARHDALTRHRQRGMCIGAFEGIQRKVIKRGRPRKHRPNMEERIDKATRTRQKAYEQEYHYASSTTGTSVSSLHSPPAETMESLSIRGSSPFDEIALFGSNSNQESVGFPPDLFTFTPPASPGYSTGNKPSPVHRSFTPTELDEIIELPSSPTPVNIAVNHESPPSLCNTSSSPMPETTMAFDFGNDPMAMLPELPKDAGRSDFDDFFDYRGMESSEQDFFLS